MQSDMTIRLADPADAPALRRLEQLDSHRLPEGDVLVGEVNGELRAALAVADGEAVADPFRPTADLVELLGVHAAHLRSATAALAPRPRRALLALAGR